MQIKDDFTITDAASGLKITVIKGIALDRLHVEIVGQPSVNNRDFFFDRDGEFDGTGSEIGDSACINSGDPQEAVTNG